MITRPLLRSLRNDLPMPFTFRLLGDRAPYAKTVEGRFRFVCPHCGDLNAVLNPRNNLAHCFNCRANINNIDLLIALGHTFRDAVEILQQHLRQYRWEQARPKPAQAAPPPRRENQGPRLIGEILRQEFERLARE